MAIKTVQQRTPSSACRPQRTLRDIWVGYARLLASYMLGNIKGSLFSRIFPATLIKIRARDHFLSSWPSSKIYSRKTSR